MVNPRQVFEAFWKTFLYHTLMFKYGNFNDFLFFLLNWPYLNEYSDIKSGYKQATSWILGSPRKDSHGKTWFKQGMCWYSVWTFPIRLLSQLFFCKEVETREVALRKETLSLQQGFCFSGKEERPLDPAWQCNSWFYAAVVTTPAAYLMEGKLWQT